MKDNKLNDHLSHDHNDDHNHDHDTNHKLEDEIDSQNSTKQAQFDIKNLSIKNKNNTYKLPFFLILTFAFVELLGGVWSQSLALLSDAWHMFSDVLALGLAWLASYLSHQPNVVKNANGQSRVEIVASVLNASLMLVVIGYIIFEAVQRLENPQPVASLTVIMIALLGLIVNLVVANMLHSADDSQAHDHNKRAAFLHVLGDLLGSVAAIAAGVVIYFTGWLQIDPILSIFISLLILGFTIKLIKDVWQSYKQG